MIVDIHRHAVSRDWLSDDQWSGFARMIAPVLQEMGQSVDERSVPDELLPAICDTNGDKHAEQLQAAGVNRAALFITDFGLLTGEPDVGLVAQNEAVMQMARRRHHLFVPFVSTDPRRPGAKAFVKRYIEELGAKGIKIHPGAGFNPQDVPAMRLIETAARYEMPVMIHTGAPVEPASGQYCHPVYLTKILEEFPEVNVIAAHMAFESRDRLFEMAAQYPNLHTDLAGWQVAAKTDYPFFARTVRQAVDAFGPRRVLFGTDNPYYWPVMSDAQYLDAVRGLATKPQPQDRLTQNEIENILGQNAKRLLNL